MDKYKFLQECLLSFISEDKVKQEFNCVEMKNLLIKHKIYNIVKYVYLDSQVYNKCSDNKRNHYHRLADCMGVFQKCDQFGIPYAVIKGAYLEKVAYMDRGVRSSNDLDLLIRKKDYKRVASILISEGFKCMNLDWETKKYVECTDRAKILYNHLYSHQSCAFFKYRNDKEFTKVDINFSITWGEDPKGSSMTDELLTKNVRMVSYQDLSYRALEPATFLFQVCLHSYRDLNSILLLKREKYKLARLCDVYYYIENKVEQIDRDAFVELVIKYSYQKPIYYILHYVMEFFGYNEWINYVLTHIDLEDKSFLNEFGLSEGERKTWNINFKERILSESLYERIEYLINDNDMEKMSSIENNM